MSQDEVALSGKAKKAKRSEERYKKGKKRKRDDPADLPGADEEELEVAEAGVQEAVLQADNEAVKKSNRSNKSPGKAGETESEAQPEAPAQKPKKRRKKTQDAATAAVTTGGEDAEQTAAGSSRQRFIVFIGNLPYHTTTASLEKHFESITPASIRHRTDPQTKRSKGFAFLEFASFDRMKTCLKLYHHSNFESGVPGDKPRRINVELTAGGGGKGENRKQKLGEKNERLEGQRKRRAEAMAKQEKRKEEKGRGKEEKGRGKKAGDGERAGTTEGGATDADDGGIHPSRLRMMHGRRQ